MFFRTKRCCQFTFVLLWAAIFLLLMLIATRREYKHSPKFVVLNSRGPRTPQLRGHIQHDFKFWDVLSTVKQQIFEWVSEMISGFAWIWEDDAIFKPLLPRIRRNTDGNDGSGESQPVCVESSCVHGSCSTDNTRCVCAEGFSGDECQYNLNECQSNPCQNNAVCIDGVDRFYCDCPDGWTGDVCSEDIDECLSSPCYGRGKCATPRLAMFMCQCVPGFYGLNCEKDIEECRSFPCLNGGNCVDITNKYICRCAIGFSGTQCETEIDECESEPCQNGALCRDEVNRFSCECRSGFHGILCDENVNECESEPCQNDGECVDESPGFSCECSTGWAGQFCQADVDECASSPCLNGGSCRQPNPGEYSCSCAKGYTGTNCVTDINECARSPCQNGGTCRDEIGRAICLCQAGYEGEFCQMEIDECSSSPCQNEATCLDMESEFECMCIDGYTGKFCQVNTNECSSYPCQNGGRCVDEVDGYSCFCLSGYLGDTCEVNVNECTSQPCANDGICVDGVASFSCQCASGFTGITCELDADECNSSPCLNGGSCQDQSRRFLCSCSTGYEGERCERETNECASVPCENGGRCVDLPNDYICECMPGFKEENCEVDIDECDSQPCMNHGTCIDGSNSYRCHCPSTHGGPICERRVTHCSTGICLNDGKCIEKHDSFQCECTDGFTGERCQTNVDDCAANPCEYGGICIDGVSSYRCMCQEGFMGRTCNDTTEADAKALRDMLFSVAPAGGILLLCIIMIGLVVCCLRRKPIVPNEFSPSATIESQKDTKDKDEAKAKQDKGKIGLKNNKNPESVKSPKKKETTPKMPQNGNSNPSTKMKHDDSRRQESKSKERKHVDGEKGSKERKKKHTDGKTMQGDEQQNDENSTKAPNKTQPGEVKREKKKKKQNDGNGNDVISKQIQQNSMISSDTAQASEKAKHRRKKTSEEGKSEKTKRKKRDIAENKDTGDAETEKRRRRKREARKEEDQQRDKHHKEHRTSKSYKEDEGETGQNLPGKCTRNADSARNKATELVEDKKQNANADIVPVEAKNTSKNSPKCVDNSLTQADPTSPSIPRRENARNPDEPASCEFSSYKTPVMNDMPLPLDHAGLHSGQEKTPLSHGDLEETPKAHQIYDRETGLIGPPTDGFYRHPNFGAPPYFSHDIIPRGAFHPHFPTFQTKMHPDYHGGFHWPSPPMPQARHAPVFQDPSIQDGEGFHYIEAPKKEISSHIFASTKDQETTRAKVSKDDVPKPALISPWDLVRNADENVTFQVTPSSKEEGSSTATVKDLKSPWQPVWKFNFPHLLMEDTQLEQGLKATIKRFSGNTFQVDPRGARPVIPFIPDRTSIDCQSGRSGNSSRNSSAPSNQGDFERYAAQITNKIPTADLSTKKTFLNNNVRQRKKRDLGHTYMRTESANSFRSPSPQALVYSRHFTPPSEHHSQSDEGKTEYEVPQENFYTHPPRLKSFQERPVPGYYQSQVDQEIQERVTGCQNFPTSFTSNAGTQQPTCSAAEYVGRARAPRADKDFYEIDYDVGTDFQGSAYPNEFGLRNPHGMSRENAFVSRR